MCEVWRGMPGPRDPGAVSWSPCLGAHRYVWNHHTPTSRRRPCSVPGRSQGGLEAGTDGAFQGRSVRCPPLTHGCTARPRGLALARRARSPRFVRRAQDRLSGLRMKHVSGAGAPTTGFECAPGASRPAPHGLHGQELASGVRSRGQSALRLVRDLRHVPLAQVGIARASGLTDPTGFRCAGRPHFGLTEAPSTFVQGSTAEPSNRSAPTFKCSPGIGATETRGRRATRPGPGPAAPPRRSPRAPPATRPPRRLAPVTPDLSQCGRRFGVASEESWGRLARARTRRESQRPAGRRRLGSSAHTGSTQGRQTVPGATDRPYR